MANIRIDNASEDALSVELDGKEYYISEDESLTVPDVKKGIHRLTVFRTKRIAVDDGKSEDGDLTAKLSRDEESQYVRLKGTFEIDINSSKSVWTVRQKSLLTEKTGVDALFSGCEVEVSGGKIVEENQSFADPKARKSFLKKQLKSAFFPIGFGIIIFTAVFLFALAANVSGDPITLGDRKFTYPWTFGLMAIDLVFIGYFTVMITNIISTLKKYQ